MTNLVAARRLTIHLTLADHFHADGHTRHTPLGTELLFRAHKAGLSGTTIIHGTAGFGHSHKIHHQPTWSLLDRAELIDAFIAANRGLFAECLATLNDLQVVTTPNRPAHPDRKDMR